MGGGGSDFERYLRALVGSWQALAMPRPDAMVVADPGFIAARFPYAVLNNAVLLDPAALHHIREFYGQAPYAVWVGADDSGSTSQLEDAAFLRDVTTRPMVCRLDQVSAAWARASDVRRDVDPAEVAELNGIPGEVLVGTPSLRCYLTHDGHSGLAVQDVDDAVVVSFVATAPAARGRGLASLLTREALMDARERGAAVAVLQATQMAERLYQRLGFRAVGEWQEWTPPRDDGMTTH